MTATTRRYAHAGWRTRGEEIRVGVDARPFYIPRCSNHDCRSPLADQAGNPRWDLLEGKFVCLGSCKQVQVTSARKADLS